VQNLIGHSTPLLTEGYISKKNKKIAAKILAKKVQVGLLEESPD